MGGSVIGRSAVLALALVVGCGGTPPADDPPDAADAVDAALEDTAPPDVALDAPPDAALDAALDVALDTGTISIDASDVIDVVDVTATPDVPRADRPTVDTRPVLDRPAGGGDNDRDGVAAPADCDDANPAVHPGATERCNGVDDDCDGATDEAGATGGMTFYRDADGDTYGAGAAVVACARPAGHATRAGDCDDARAAVHPGATEVCGNRVDDDCRGGDATCPDADGDGYRSNVDCNDANYRVNPGRTDLCSNRVDEDCDGRDAACACAKRLHVLVDDYGTIDGRALEALSNGCWEVHSVNDGTPLEFRHCFHGTVSGYACGGHIRQPDGDNWYYDDTNASHGGEDARLIRLCATRCGTTSRPDGVGFVTMAASGGWRYESGGISPVIFIAQLYTSASDQAMQPGLFSAWAGDRRAAPQIAFTHATRSQMVSWTTQVCARLNSGNWIAYYAGSGRNTSRGGMGPLDAADLRAWATALNGCTR